MTKNLYAYYITGLRKKKFYKEQFLEIIWQDVKLKKTKSTDIIESIEKLIESKKLKKGV